MTIRDSSPTRSREQTTLDLLQRPRRLRRTEALRTLVRETHLSADNFMYPLFVCEGTNVRVEVSSMPGVFKLSVDEAVKETEAALKDGVRSILLFGVPDSKDESGSAAWAPENPVQVAIRVLKEKLPQVILASDVCLCGYTLHGHCGVIVDDEIANDATVEQLVRIAISHAEAGADIVAPSDMMDGRVKAIRQALDNQGYDNVAIMSYAAKYCSAFYAPFRDAANSSPSFGDRRTHQMDPANTEEALKEVALDLEEGADIIMIKPAGPYLDVIARIKAEFMCPTAAYQVSGEYAMLKAASQNGWLEESSALLESLLAIKRAGANIIITYYAREAARLLR